MNYRSIAKNAAVAFSAQGVALILSIIQTLLVPKLLGTTQYGYWQLFIFYTSYVGFAHFGLNDGVYLIKGGQSRTDVDKKDVNSQFAFGVSFQLAISAAVVLSAISGGFGEDRDFVIICTGVLLTIRNAASFLMYLLQAMNETKKSSYATIVERLSFLAPLIFLIVVHSTSYKPFILFYIISGVIQLAYCIWQCRDFLVSGLHSPRYAALESFKSIRVGFKLMMANIASMLILGIMRFAIDVNWGIDTFGELSLALSLVSFFLQFMAQAAMVLFPALRQANQKEVRRFYGYLSEAISLFSPIIFVLCYPVVWLLSLWLPDYANSFSYFILLIPICIFDSKMNICCTTFFKVLRKEESLLRVNVLTCLLSAGFTLIGVFILRSIFAVISGVVIAIVGRSLLSESLLTRELNIAHSSAMTIGELMLAISFIVTALTLPTAAALGVYCVLYIAYLTHFKHRVFGLIDRTKKLTRKG